MSPSQENWSPSEGNFKPLDKAFSTILHGSVATQRCRGGDRRWCKVGGGR